jgi:hypothetical protein
MSRKCDPQVLGFKYAAVRSESDWRLKFNRFSFSDGSLVAVGEELTDHVEHGVTEANYVRRVSRQPNREFMESKCSTIDRLFLRKR